MAKAPSKQPGKKPLNIATSAPTATALARLRELAQPTKKSPAKSKPAKSKPAKSKPAKSKPATSSAGTSPAPASAAATSPPKAPEASPKAPAKAPAAPKAPKNAPKTPKTPQKSAKAAVRATKVSPLATAPQLTLGSSVLPRVTDMLCRVPKEHVTSPILPVPQLVSEALGLFAVAKLYAERLAKIGFSDAMLQGLQLYAQALHEAQTQLESQRGKQSTPTDLKVVSQALELRSQLLLAARLTLRKDRKVMESLDAIAEGEGLADLARDLLDLALLAETYPAQLSRVGLGLDIAQKARELSRKIAAKLDSVKTPTDEHRTIEDLRNRAATVLHELMAEARLGGAYVFRKEPRIALLFTATHRHGSR